MSSLQDLIRELGKYPVSDVSSALFEYNRALFVGLYHEWVEFYWAESERD